MSPIKAYILGIADDDARAVIREQYETGDALTTKRIALEIAERFNVSLSDAMSSVRSIIFEQAAKRWAGLEDGLCNIKALHRRAS